MKKLLVILLLLFPFHGAWATADKFSLICIFNTIRDIETGKVKTLDHTSTTHQMSFIIDLKKEITGRGHRIDFIDEQSFKWRAPARHELIDGAWLIHILQVDRITGKIESNISYPLSWDDTVYYKENRNAYPKFEFHGLGTCESKPFIKKF